jgi:tetratricopeptide (TPR) repeat protein
MRAFVPRVALVAAFVASVGACSGGGGAAYGVAPGTPEVASRALVLIPAFPGPQGANVANELRGLVTQMTTHAAISNSALNASMKEYGLTELNEISARQLASIIGAQLVAWGEVTQNGSALTTTVKFVDSRSGDQIDLPANNGATPLELATAVFGGFERSVEGMRQAATCTDNVRSSQFDAALQACNAALAVIPNSATALLGKGNALYGLKRYSEALAAFNQVLAIDGTNQDALLRAGLSSSWEKNGAAALGFFNRYLEINPGDATTRLALAGEIAQSEDFLTAFRVLDSGSAANATNADYQGIVFQMGSLAGRALREAGDTRQSDEVFQKALAAYQVAYGNAANVDTPVTIRMIELLTASGRTDDAVRAGETALARKPNDTQILGAMPEIC